ncbi:PIN domain nuclease, a component of toxin-antitoxin system (PIN domain) [Streptoalloteichus tenebrarius]|uniref:PIN domain nuclease, a component of toxin-antitoxin system (PIN domain) n=1 Tax=Streptoalloteichus tenebrarius (strain ATCC 17920 / DSM 40477 / JCM 4838 / CBS 697.72 / NBRC 16177 / NCIMB 11028 / NRRL B-12390 / A12253. 1 / ISP 5477) TaxID=1933 RepID=A0ABT1HRC6_STRSD|nr:PIN domain-containing protein [Streptoalloteichus tenebrarius]MCP2258075.1 PIN domain nuclease, a component of toxin-antitoxin system (PIN domain) [Streptoalloteichus tenebrarius]BFF01746.1 hypothetical protein GCM10020241_34210 [Streptoalloteichus tenebrarius]
MTARRQLPRGPVLVDASFVLALLDDDRDAGRFADVLSRAAITAINYGEVLHTLHDLAGLSPEQVEFDLAATGLTVHPVDGADALRFPELRRLDAKARRAAGVGAAGGLSLGDVCCLARAWSTGLPVLTGDKHWLAVAAAGLPVPVFDFRAADLRT